MRRRRRGTADVDRGDKVSELIRIIRELERLTDLVEDDEIYNQFFDLGDALYKLLRQMEGKHGNP